MKRPLPIFILFLFFSFIAGIKAQNVNVEVQITEVERTNYNDCSLCYGAPDPTWSMSGYTNGSGGTQILTNWKYFYGEMSGTTWGGHSDQIVYHGNSSASSVILSLEAWENDCELFASDFEFDQGGWCFDFINGGFNDTRHGVCNNFMSIPFKNDSACQWNSYTTPWCGSYRYKVQIYWTWAEAPTITTHPTPADRSVCTGTPTTLSVVVNSGITPSPGRFFQWEYSINTSCTTPGTWYDVTAAYNGGSPGTGYTTASYTPPQIPGTRLYRVKTTSNCIAYFSTLTTYSNCTRVTYHPMTSPPFIQAGICGLTVLPGSANILNTIEAPTPGAAANVSYQWTDNSGRTPQPFALGSSAIWNAPTTPGSYAVSVTYVPNNPACSTYTSSGCNVTVASPDCGLYLYVSPSNHPNTPGTDFSGCGGSGNPCATVGYAVANVLGSKRHLRVASGTINETQLVNMVSNLIIEGMFTVNNSIWGKTNNPSSQTNLIWSGPGSFENAPGNNNSICHRVGIKSSGANNWTLMDVNISTAAVNNGFVSNDLKGCSNYGVLIYNSTGYKIVRSNITAGAASKGDNGLAWSGTGSAGGGGTGGTAGGPSNRECGCSYGYNGGYGVAGGAGNLGATGGGGGNRGGCDGCNSLGCSASGSNGSGGGTAGGGSAGANAPAAPAAPAAAAQYYLPLGQAASGNNGAGGGGGGGGGGGDIGTCCGFRCGFGLFGCGRNNQPYGGNGGSGGGGGLGGKGGFGGGGSFAVYASGTGTGDIGYFNAAAGSAGIGGTGAAGQSGAVGFPGVPGTYTGGCGGTASGGSGGYGGGGGAGGTGQTGANGISQAVVAVSPHTLNQTASGNNPSSTNSLPALTVFGANLDLCPNSEIQLGKSTGTWSLPSGLNLVYDKLDAPAIGTPSTSYTFSSNPISVYTTSVNTIFDLTINSSPNVVYDDVLKIGSRVRTLPNISVVPSTICYQGTAVLSAAPSSSWGQQIKEHDWDIYSGNNLAAPVFSSSLANPTTPALSCPSAYPCTYTVRYREREECCGWSIPVFSGVTILPEFKRGTVNNTGKTVCYGSDPNTSISFTTLPQGTGTSPGSSSNFDFSWYYRRGNSCPSSSSTTGWIAIGTNSSTLSASEIDIIDSIGYFTHVFACWVAPQSSLSPICGTADWAENCFVISVLPEFNAGTVQSGDQGFCGGGNPSEIFLFPAPQGSGFTYQWYYNYGNIISDGYDNSGWPTFPPPCPSGTNSSQANWKPIPGANGPTFDPPPFNLHDSLTLKTTPPQSTANNLYMGYALYVTPAAAGNLPQCGSTGEWAFECRAITETNGTFYPNNLNSNLTGFDNSTIVWSRKVCYGFNDSLQCNTTNNCIRHEVHPTNNGGEVTDYRVKWESSLDFASWTFLRTDSPSTGIKYYNLNDMDSGFTQSTYYRAVVLPVNPPCGDEQLVNNYLFYDVFPEFDPGDITGDVDATYCYGYDPPSLATNAVGVFPDYYNNATLIFTDYKWESSVWNGTSWSSFSAVSNYAVKGSLGTVTRPGGVVTAVAITNGGIGYVTAPVVTITGNGTGATATATITNGVITAININNGGSGYTTASATLSNTVGLVNHAYNITYDPGTLTQTTRYRYWVKPTGFSSSDCYGTRGTADDVVADTITYTILTQFSQGAITPDTFARTQCLNYDAPLLSVSPTGSSGVYNFQWESSPDGTNWAPIAGATSPFYDRTDLMTDTTYFRVYIDPTGTPDCQGAYSNNNVLIKIGPSTPANAGSDATICASGYTFSANSPPSPLKGTGWNRIAGSGNFVGLDTIPNATVSGLSGTILNNGNQNKFVWTIVTNLCVTTRDTVVITRDLEPDDPNAGIDLKVCDADSVQLSGNAVTVPGAIGTWSHGAVVAGAGGTILNPNSYNTWLDNLESGLTQFRWVTSHGVCPAKVDVVNVFTSIFPFMTWNGEASENWNDPVNWGCGNIPGIVNRVIVPFVANLPQIRGGNVGICDSIEIQPFAALKINDFSKFGVDKDFVWANAGPDLNACGSQAPVQIGAQYVFGQDAYTDYLWTTANDSIEFNVLLSDSTSPEPELTLSYPLIVIGGDTVALPKTIQFILTATHQGEPSNTDSDTMNFTINFVPDAYTGGPVLTYCLDSIQLGGSGNPGHTYLWEPQSGIKTGDENISNPKAAPGSTTTYILTETVNATGCLGSDTVRVNKVTAPTANVSAAPNPICTGDSSTLTFTLTGSVTTYDVAYTTNGGTPDTLNNISNNHAIPTGVLNDTALYQITWVHSDASGCSSPTGGSANLIVNPVPSVSIDPATVAFCDGDDATLTATGSGTIGTYTYSWTTGNNTASIPVSPTVTTNYTVTVTDGRGCTVSGTRTVTVYPSVAVGVLPETATLCIGGNVMLVATVSTGTAPYSFVWSPGTLPDNDTVTVSPTDTTNYVVDVTDANGCSGSDGSIIYTYPSPSLSISSVPASATICKDAFAQLTAGATGGSPGYSYVWSGSVGTGTGPKVVYPIVDSTYSATVTDNFSCTATASKTVYVNQKPTVNTTEHDTSGIATDDFITCSGGKVYLSASGSGTTAPYAYAWDQGLGSGADKTANPTGTITYTVTVTDNSSTTCSNTGSVAITVRSNPIVDLAATETSGATNNDGTICNGYTTTQLTASITSGGQSPFTYSWSPNIGTGAGPHTIPSTSTNYQVGATDANNCSGITAKFITVVALPATPTWSQTTATVCEGSNAVVYTASGAGGNYTWSKSGCIGCTGCAGTGNSVTLDFTSCSPPGSGYGLTVTETNPATNCTSAQLTQPITINSGSPPNISGHPSSVTICAGANTSFTGSASGTGLTYQWQEYQTSSWADLANGGVYSNVDQPTLIITGATAGMTGFKYRLQISGPCPPPVPTNEAILTINAPAAPTAGNASRCGDGTVTISATPGGGETIDWFAASTGGTLLTPPGAGSTTYTTGSITAGSTDTKYAEARNTTSGCVSATRTAVVATANTLPSAPTGTPGSRCGTGTVDITASVNGGETVDWYAASSGGTALSSGNTTFTTGTITPGTYTSSTETKYAETRNTTTGCISSARTAVTGTANPTTASDAPATLTVAAYKNGSNMNVTLTATAGTNTAAGTTWTWYRSTTSGACSAGSSVGTGLSYTATDTGTYTILAKSTCSTGNCLKQHLQSKYLHDGGYPTTANALYWDVRKDHCPSAEGNCTSSTHTYKADYEVTLNSSPTNITWTWDATNKFYKSGAAPSAACTGASYYILIATIDNGTSANYSKNIVCSSSFVGFNGGTANEGNYQYDGTQNALTNFSTLPARFNAYNMFVSPVTPLAATYCKFMDQANDGASGSCSILSTSAACVTISAPNRTLAYLTDSTTKGAGAYYLATNCNNGAGTGCCAGRTQSELIPAPSTTPVRKVSQQQLDYTATNYTYCVATYGNGWRLPTDIEAGHTSDIDAVSCATSGACELETGYLGTSGTNTYVWTSSQYEGPIQTRRFAVNINSSGTSPSKLWTSGTANTNINVTVNKARCVFDAGYPTGY